MGYDCLFDLTDFDTPCMEIDVVPSRGDVQGEEIVASKSSYSECGNNVVLDFLPRYSFIEIETIAFRKVLLLLESLDP